jgi:uncharacterized protein
MNGSAPRQKVHFTSANTTCAAWHHPGVNGGCVIMAGGLAVTKEPAGDRFARRFQDAGYTVLTFDYRRFGESGGEPRQVARVQDQIADWHAAVAFASELPDVDPARIAAWGFSVSAGYLFKVAAQNPAVAAVIAQSPLASGQAATNNALRHSTIPTALRLAGRGIRDAIGGRLGRPPLLIPLAGRPGEVAALTTPDAMDGDPVLNAGDVYPDWQQTVAARSALRIGFFRPERYISRVACPLLFVVCDQDRSCPAEPTVRVARRAPQSELVRVPGTHYAPFTGAHEQVVAAELSFLERHLLRESPAKTQTRTEARTQPPALQGGRS